MCDWKKKIKKTQKNPTLSPTGVSLWGQSRARPFWGSQPCSALGSLCKRPKGRSKDQDFTFPSKQSFRNPPHHHGDWSTGNAALSTAGLGGCCQESTPRELRPHLKHRENTLIQLFFSLNPFFQALGSEPLCWMQCSWVGKGKIWD